MNKKKGTNICEYTGREIADCPFCGNMNIACDRPQLAYVEPLRLDTLWFVVCDECGVSTKRVGDREDAIDLWNNRVGLEEEKEHLNHKDEVANIAPYEAIRYSIELLDKAIDVAYIACTEDATIELEPVLDEANARICSAIQDLEVASIYVDEEDDVDSM